MDEFQCKKVSTKDNRDGLSILHLKADPREIPHEIKQGSYGDRYNMKATFEHHESEFEAIRFTVDDDGKGFIVMKLAVLPAQVGDEFLYAPNGSIFTINYELMMTPSDIVPFTPEHRLATLRRLQVILSEPQFWQFLEQHDHWNLLKEPFQSNTDRQDAALEILYRTVGCHSRSDITKNAAVCERTERLIREYRKQIWSKRDPSP